MEVPSDNQNLDMIELIARLSCHESDYVLNVVSASSDDHGITNVALKKKVSGDQKKVMDEFINNRLVGKNLALSIIISSEQMSLLLS